MPPELPAAAPVETGRAVRWRRGGAVVAHAVALWLTARLRCPRLSSGTRLALAGRCARRMLAILAVDVRCRGARPPAGGPCLIVANHVSWLDVHVLNAVAGVRSVAKAELRSWPIAGAVARGFDTIFIVRGSVRDARRVKDLVAAALRAGHCVLVFPEGTTTDGATVGRFHAALFQAAVDTGAPIQPVAIRYRRPDGVRDAAAAFVGDTTLVASILAVLRRPAITAELTWGRPVLPHGLGRRDLVEIAHRFVRLVLADAWEPRRRAVTERRAA